MVDHKAAKWHSYSPHNFVLNNPLIYLDPDGEDVIVAFTGGFQGGGKTISPNSKGAASTGRLILEAEKFSKENGIDLDTRVIASGVTASSSVNNALGFIKENYTAGENLIIYGYNYGGDFAVELAEALKGEGIQVNLLITVDTADSPLQNGAVNDIIADNVKSAVNNFQTNSSGKSSASQNSGSVKKTDSNSGPSNSPGSKGNAKKVENSTKTKLVNYRAIDKYISDGNTPDKALPHVSKMIQEILKGKQISEVQN